MPRSHPFHNTWLGRNPGIWGQLKRLIPGLRYHGDDNTCKATGIPSGSYIHLRLTHLEDNQNETKTFVREVLPGLIIDSVVRKVYSDCPDCPDYPYPEKLLRLPRLPRLPRLLTWRHMLLELAHVENGGANF